MARLRSDCGSASRDGPDLTRFERGGSSPRSEGFHSMAASTLDRPLRLLVIPDKYLPDQCGGGAIYTDMCRGLARRGLDVTVRCPYPFYPEWTDKSGRNGFRVDRTVDHGVRVERFGMFIPANSRSVWQR